MLLLAQICTENYQRPTLLQDTVNSFSLLQKKNNGFILQSDKNMLNF